MCLFSIGIDDKAELPPPDSPDSVSQLKKEADDYEEVDSIQDRF